MACVYFSECSWSLWSSDCFDDFSLSSFATYFAGSFLKSFTQSSQQNAIVRPLYVWVIVLSASSPLTGHFAFSSACFPSPFLASSPFFASSLPPSPFFSAASSFSTIAMYLAGSFLNSSGQPSQQKPMSLPLYSVVTFGSTSPPSTGHFLLIGFFASAAALSAPNAGEKANSA